MAFGLNLGHDYRQGALSWQGSDGKSKTGSYLSCLLLLASPFQPHSPDRSKHCSPLASWWAASVLQFTVTLLALCLSMQQEKRQQSWVFCSKEKAEMSKPSQGSVQVSFCMRNLSWRQALHSLVITEPRERLFKRSQGSSAAPAHGPERFLTDRVTTQSMADPRSLLALRHMPMSRI